MNSKKSLNSIANTISQEFYDESLDGNEVVCPKTIIRNFEKFINKCGGDIVDLKNSNGKIFFEETESVFIKAILRESVDKESYVYKLLKDKDDEVSFNTIKVFMENIDGYMKDKLSDEERESYMSYMDQSLKYSVIMELRNIYNIIEFMNLNLEQSIYSYHLQSVIKLRKKMEQEFARTIGNSMLYMEEFVEFVDKAREIFDGDVTQVLNYDEYDLQTKMEYTERDVKLLKYIKSNALVKQHVEEKMGKKIEEIFNGVYEKID